jgi:hypothetical protein
MPKSRFTEEAKPLTALKSENGRLKRLVDELAPNNSLRQDVVGRA